MTETPEEYSRLQETWAQPLCGGNWEWVFTYIPTVLYTIFIYLFKILFHFYRELKYKWSCFICELVKPHFPGLIRVYNCRQNYWTCFACLNQLFRVNPRVQNNACAFGCNVQIVPFPDAIPRVSIVFYPQFLVDNFEERERRAEPNHGRGCSSNGIQIGQVQNVIDYFGHMHDPVASTRDRKICAVCLRRFRYNAQARFCERAHTENLRQ